MTNRAFTIEELGPRRVLVRAIGTITPRDVAELGQHLLPRGEQPGWELLFDFTEIEGCTAKARAHLAELQRSLVAQEVRTAFVTAHPRYRGIALWISHVANDPRARSFYRMNQAEQWFASRQSRTQSITGYLDRTRGRRRTPGGSPSERLRHLRQSRPDKDTNE